MQITARLMVLVVSLAPLATIGQRALGQTSAFNDYRLFRHPEGCQEGPGCVPVVFIHGIHGSTQDGPCALDAPAESDCYWSPLLNHLRARFNRSASSVVPKLQPYIFRYLSDKDDSTLDIGRKLLQLADCEVPSGVPCTKVNRPLIIVAHSMGGIVARTFMLQHTSTSPDPGYRRVLAAITLATPHHGTPLANREWRNWKAEQFNVGVPDVTLLLNNLDKKYWEKENGSPHLADDSSRPNRSDLVWDNYDDYFSDAAAARPQPSWERNAILSTLASSEQARKLIVYGGYLDPQVRGTAFPASDLFAIVSGLKGDYDALDNHQRLELVDSALRSRLRILIGSDGLVPLDSALFNRNQYVGLRRAAFKDFDHLDMRDGIPESDARRKYNADLFASLANDIEAVLKWGGVPPRLLSLATSSETASSGSVVRLTYQLKTAFEAPTRVKLKASVSGAASCDVVEVQPGNTSAGRDFRIPPGIATSAVNIIGEVLPESASCDSPGSSYDITRAERSISVIPATPVSSQPLLSSVVQAGGAFGAFQHGTKVAGYYRKDSSGNWLLLGLGLRGSAPPSGTTCTVDLVHAGVDIVAAEGTPIFPIADGAVQDLIDNTTDVNFNSLGYMVLIRHNQMTAGKVTYSLYLHMATKPDVVRNQPVTAKQTKLGVVGATGAAFGVPHLHLEVRHFSQRFSPTWSNIYGVEAAACGRNQTFNSTDFANSWSDPSNFLITTSSTSAVGPTISLSTATPAKKEYRIGEAIQLILATTAGSSSGQGAAAALVSTFLFRDGPDGRKFLILDNQGRLTETPVATPVSTPAPPITYSTALPLISVLPSTAQGSYSWRAELYASSVFDPQNRIAASGVVDYRILAERIEFPAVTSIGTGLSLYRPGDTMVINYTTTRGSAAVTYDFMLRLTSKATGNDYYFYDNASDSNRWIHSSPRYMLRGPASDGQFQIPSGTLPSIVIENDTPSGDYLMLAYFSETAKNSPVGGAAQSSFRLETPTAEGACFVATAAFGSPMSGAVGVLRAFRDQILLSSAAGRYFVATYYRVGPRLASIIAPRAWMRKGVRALLWPLIGFGTAALHLGFWGALGLCLLVLAGLYRFVKQTQLVVRLLILGAVLVIASFAAEIQGTVVRGKPFPTPIAGARVEIENTSSNTVADGYGRFAFDRLSTGNYTLRASAPGYLPATTSVSITTTNATHVVVIAPQPVGSRTYEYYMPHTAEADGWWTFFTLLNPNPTAADVMMAAYDAKGNFLGTSAKITLLKIGQQVTGSPSQYFAADVAARAAYYKFTSSAPVVGFEIFGQTTGTLAAFPLTTAQSNTAYLPHIAEDSQWWTGISFVSGGISANGFHLEARDRTGSLLAEASSVVSLRPGEKTVDQLVNYFGWDFPLGISWAKVRSDGPITGFELFGTKDFKMLAAVPAVSRGIRAFYLPHIATTDGWWTGIAMLNVDTGPGVAVLKAYGGDGRLLATSRSIPLNSLERTVGVVESYFDAWPPTGVAYVEVTSNADLIAFELTGRFTPPLFGGLSSLPPLGSTIAFPYTISNADWDTSLGVVNASPSATTVVLEAMNADGSKRGEARFSLAAKGFRFATLRALFGSVPSGTSWVKARADGGATLSGFLKLSRVATGEFTDIPAEAAASPEQVGQPTLSRLATVAADSPRSRSPILF